MHKKKEYTFIPDAQYQERGFPIVIMEAKKPPAANHLAVKDEFKLDNMMKLSLDLMIGHQVENPTVVGLLVQRKSNFLMFVLGSQEC
jgi:hypothetical protein